MRRQFVRSRLGSAVFARDRDHLQSRFRQSDFVRLCAVHVQAVAIHHRHHFRAFADFRLVFAFLVGTKLQSSLPLLSSDHSFNRRQQVLSEPYSRGNSSHGQPVFSTYRMLFNVGQSSLPGRYRLLDFSGIAVRLPPIVHHLAHVCSCLYFIISTHF
jgi:hypothetical protein